MGGISSSSSARAARGAESTCSGRRATRRTRPGPSRAGVCRPAMRVGSTSSIEAGGQPASRARVGPGRRGATGRSGRP
eukprot:11156107-Lingulodinium_polyedra.AAC.1